MNAYIIVWIMSATVLYSGDIALPVLSKAYTSIEACDEQKFKDVEWINNTITQLAIESLVPEDLHVEVVCAKIGTII